MTELIDNPPPLPEPSKFPATRTVHCPNGPVDCCDHHAALVTSLMRFLGAHVVHTAAPDGAECANCKNESDNKQ